MAHWFTKRMEQLIKERKTSKSALGQEAGLSHATIGKWMQQADDGNFSPRLKEIELLAKYTGRPVAWFLTEGPSTPVSLDPATGHITAADLNKTAQRLTDYAGIPEDEAWLLMRDVVAPDAESLYFAALDVLRSRSLEKQHGDTVREMERGSSPVRRIKKS